MIQSGPNQLQLETETLRSRIISVGILVAATMLFAACGGTGNTSRPASPTAATASADKPLVIHKVGDTVSIGYTSYKVHKAWWSNTLSENSFLNDAPDATYLFVELTVRNDDTKPRSVPPFKLIDQSKREYEPSARGWAVEDSIGVLESLNPTVTKTGYVVFDVPRENTYQLQVSGGYWSGDSALIALADDAPTERKQRSKKAGTDQAGIHNGRDVVPAVVEPVTSAKSTPVAVKPPPDDPPAVPKDKTLRKWTSTSGHTTEAEFVSAVGGKATLRKQDGKMVTLSIDKLSAEDQDYLRRQQRK